MALKAALHIETASRGETTFLKSSFHSPPFKIANVSEGKKQLRLMLMNASPGVLDGDDYSLHINVAAYTHLTLHTQSYQRLFHMQHGATQSMHLIIGEHAHFVYLPHPTVPHQQSIFKTFTKIILAKSSTLFWSEVIACGRRLNGEVFQFTSYHSITEIWIDDKLAVKENLLLQPAKISLMGMGQMEGYTHQASLLYITENADTEATIQMLLSHFEKEKDIACGISALPVNGLIVRLLGHKAEQLFNLLQWTAQRLQQPVAQKPEAYVA